MVSISDGDTLVVLRNGHEQVRIRLHGIDAPEKGQAFGAAAKEQLGELVHERDVLVIERELDRYGRTVAELRVAGRDVGLDMVRAGLAWWYRKYAQKDVGLREAELAARAERTGLWRETATPPWEWRRAR